MSELRALLIKIRSNPSDAKANTFIREVETMFDLRTGLPNRDEISLLMLHAHASNSSIISDDAKLVAYSDSLADAWLAARNK